MKKIVYLHQYFCRPSMNGGIRSYEFAKRLAADGYDVHIVTSDRERTFSGWKVERLDGFTVHWVSVLYNNKLGFLARIFAFLRFSILASFRVCRLKADLNFATSTPLTIVIPALLAKVFLKTPYVFEVRDLWPEIPIALGAIKGRLTIGVATVMAALAYKYASKIVVLSPDMGEGVKKYGDYHNKIVLIPNASDVALLRTTNRNAVIEFWQSYGIDCTKSHIVVYTGTLGRVNRVNYMVDLAKNSIFPNIFFVVFGDGAEKEIILECAQQQNVLNKNFFMFPPVGKKDLVHVLGGVSLSLSLVDNIPVLWGNSANKFFDAFAAGVPVGINHGGWQASVIEDNSCGVVLSQEPVLASKQLLEFILDKEKLSAAKEKSAFLGEHVYSRDVLYHKFHTTLSDVLS